MNLHISWKPILFNASQLDAILKIHIILLINISTNPKSNHTSLISNQIILINQRQ